MTIHAVSEAAAAPAAPVARAPRVQAIHHVGLLVPDLELAAPFYRDLLGLEPRDDRPDFGVRGIWFDVGDSQQLHLFEGNTPPDGGQHVALQVADLDEVMAHLRANGYKVSGFPRGGPYVQAVVFDPAGNRVELYLD